MRILHGLIGAALLGVVLSAAAIVDLWLPGGPHLPLLPIVAWILYMPAFVYAAFSLSGPRRIGSFRIGGRKPGPLLRALPKWVGFALGAVALLAAAQTYLALTRPVPAAAQTPPEMAGLELFAAVLSAAAVYALWLVPDGAPADADEPVG